MSLMRKISQKMRDKLPNQGNLEQRDYRDWAKYPRSQRAVDLMFSNPPMLAEIEFARNAGYIDGYRWVPPHQRNAKQNEGKFPLNEIEREPGCDDE